MAMANGGSGCEYAYVAFSVKAMLKTKMPDDDVSSSLAAWRPHPMHPSQPARKHCIVLTYFVRP